MTHQRNNFIIIYSSIPRQFMWASFKISALSVSQKCLLEEKYTERVQSIVEHLNSYHFSDAQVAKLIVKRPKVLQCKVKVNLQPKFDYFVQIGLVGELLPQLIVSNPVIFKRSLDSHIKPSIQFLRLLIDIDEKILLAIKRCSWLLTSNLKVIKPNFDFLRKEGVTVKKLECFIILHPRVMTQKPDRMVYAVNAVKNLGFKPGARMFVRALRVMVSMSESTWKKKIEVMKSMGWDEEEILPAFKRDPVIICC